MTLFSKWKATDNQLGVDVMTVVATATFGAIPIDLSYPQPPFQLGERVQGDGGSEWMFVQASATVTAFNVVAIDENFRVANIDTTLVASNAYSYGIAHFSQSYNVTATAVANTGETFWALMNAKGGYRVNVIGSAQPGASLYVSTSIPGYLTVTASSTGSAQMYNIFPAVSLTVSGTAAVTAVGGINNAVEFFMVGYLRTSVTAVASL